MAEPNSLLPHAAPAGAIDDCWRRIGVTGDRTCPLLATHITCRNCPVYAQAALVLLDTLAIDPIVQPASGSDTPIDQSSADRLAGESYMVFRVGDEWLALPTATLGEVTAPALVHSLLHRRHAALIGVAAVRGALLTCISLALLFGESAEPTEPTEPTESNGRGGQDAQRAARFLILGQGRNAIALPVAEVAGVERVTQDVLLPLPATLARASARYSRALFDFNGHSVGLLDADLLRQALTRSLS
ncbi:MULTISPECIES: chemotaxis protein CheW [Cupriavidus]|jgi:chemotaxis-related protein WspD|uniref:Chemotaxis protein CheW n=1 Tax=Cupriavidus metallidurans TaxID=119219 RepID=A0A482ISB1_9BURK|nr:MULTISPECIES: chemotaxis protein CheW [Cupriavidus]KWR75873.1 chemotaxis protein CheR [Cupriavidus sp. SHE]QBP11975.1 chemotaxis protein CheW [Cupriavidus metallidurans]QWC91942.1 chemotaxis protein CheW [Cupriavidus metallidurans]